MFRGEQEDTAGYIHSSAIAREYAGQGIGAKVIRLTYNHKYTLPNGNKMEDKAEMTRKKIKTEK